MDFAEAMRLMLQQERPEDFVVAVGETRSVKNFLDRAFKRSGINWRDYVKFAPA